MELDVRLVKSFVAVADERSFTRAAERLHVAQPWLSVQIRKLEEQLGFRLFERNRNRAVVPSSKAEAFLPAAREYLVSVERLAGCARRIRNETTVLLRLGAPDFSADMPVRTAIIDEFLALHPTYEIEVANAWTVEILKRLRDGELDIGFTVGPHVDPHSEAMVLARYRLALLTTAGFAAAHDQPLPLAELAGSQVAIFRRNVNPAFHDSIAPLLEAAGIGISYLVEPGVPAILHYTQRTGIPALVGEWHAHVANLPDTLAVVELDERALSFNLNLVRRVGDRSPVISALWDFAMKSIAG